MTTEHLPAADRDRRIAALDEATSKYTRALEELLPEGPDKTYALRELRGAAMWANAIVMEQRYVRRPD